MLGLLAIASGSVQGEKMALVENGQSDYVILTPAEPSPSEALAAQELGKYIEQMSGAKLDVKADSAVPNGEHTEKAVVVIEARRISEWSSTPAGISGETYCIWRKGDTIFVVGGRGRSTLYAAYDLLQRLGCRFLAPKFDHYQATAEIIPRKTTLALDLSTPIVEKPVLALRKQYVEEGHSHNAENLAQMVEWMPKARFNTLVIPTDYSGRGAVKWDNWREKLTPELQERDITIEVGGHGYQNFMNADMEDGKLFDQHPEWFGQNSEGARERQRNRVFCTSNPDAVKYLTASLVKYLKERPEIQIYDFWPPDGARWCECDKCKALGSPPNRQAVLIGRVRPEVEKARPGLRLECIAYAAALAPAESAKLDNGVLVDFCPIAQSFEVQINDPQSKQNADYVEKLKAWRKYFGGDISIYSYYRKYAWKSLPNLIPHYMQRDIRFYMTVPVQGISSYAEPGDWFTYELNHYVLGRLAWNPETDVDALIEEFASARYGPASEVAMGAYAVLEEVVRHGCGLPGTSLKSVEELTEAREKLQGAVDGLKAARSGVSDAAVRHNIDRLLLAFEYAGRDIDIQKSRASGAPKAEVRKQIEDLAAFLQSHAEDGVFVVHSRVEFPRILKTYGIDE